MTRLCSKDAGALNRFVAAQNSTYDLAMSELVRGRKQSHWMWFIFPQLRGLGHSPMSHHYGIEDTDEARRYLEHAVLGPRLIACGSAVLSHPDLTAIRIFGAVDARKLHSSATLFRLAGAGTDVFNRIITSLFHGDDCGTTEDRVRTDGSSGVRG